MRTEKWCGHEIRFIEIKGEWYAVLKDICDALKLRAKDVSQRIDSSMLERVLINTSEDDNDVLRYDHKSVDTINKGLIGKDIGRKPGENKTRWMLAVNEAGIYQALFASRKIEARKFQLWTFDILKKLRHNVGLKGYEVMRMADSDIQEEINHILDDLYWDNERGCLMESYTVPGGDVEQRPFRTQLD